MNAQLIAPMSLVMLLASCPANDPGRDSSVTLDARADTAPTECPSHRPYRFGNSCCQFEDGSICEVVWCDEGTWMPWSPDTELWWTTAPPTRCAETLSHTPPQPYDDCSPSVSGEPGSCGEPRSGALVCHGAWMIACESSLDCPATMGCDYSTVEGLVERPEERPVGNLRGLCVNRCSTPGSSVECLRCDQACLDAGYCGVPPLAPGHDCFNDCECWDVVDPGYGVGACLGGQCWTQVGGPRVGLCGDDPKWDCACNGGTCEAHPEGGCCRLPNGSIAQPGSAACVGPGADGGV